MATVKPTETDVEGDGSVKIYQWTPLTTTNVDGAPVNFAQWADRSIQVTGTFGAGGTVLWQGSNDGTNWATLSNYIGDPLSVTAASIVGVSGITKLARPYVSAGDGTTSITVTALVRRPNPMRT